MQTFPTIDPLTIAARHNIVASRPAPNFFEGAVLGNGGLGAIVTTRPDAVRIFLGHNSVWDIRLAEENADKIGTFQEVFNRVKQIDPALKNLADDPWYAKYSKMVVENYRQKYPRPFPCGSLVLQFDRAFTEVLGHEVDISSGQCRVHVIHRGAGCDLLIFVDMHADRVWIRVDTKDGVSAGDLVTETRLIPDPHTPAELSRPTVSAGQHSLSFTQHLPSLPPVDGTSPPSLRDRAVRVTARFDQHLHNSQRIDWGGEVVEFGPLERAFDRTAPPLCCLELEHGLAADVASTLANGDAPTNDAFEAALASSQESWSAYWALSGVELGNAELEEVWYRNLYFMNCATAAGVTCPGLFANWSYGDIGTAWHGDYHMNYNTQQPFWMCFSANHLDKHLPYVDLVDHLMPVSKSWAKDYYGLRGAYFPHSAYPVEMNIPAYPSPEWGWEICETPWTVQSLWWHYQYSQDVTFLAERAFDPIKQAVLFLVDYLLRPEASGPQWGDDYYHVFPTCPPELFGLKPGFRHNADAQADLTLIRFLLKAYLDAVEVLNVTDSESDLLAQVRDVLAHLVPDPVAASPVDGGVVYTAAPGADPGLVHNCPANLMNVFPGDEIGLGSDPTSLDTARRTLAIHRNEGGNDVVFMNVQAARLARLDVAKFTRQCRYCKQPNGTYADMVNQVHGRYSDETPFNFMAPMGIWFENFGLPFVINECLLQSHDGTIRLFPNWPADQSASFETLRTVGAFLVSSAITNGNVAFVRIASERGGMARLLSPWAKAAVSVWRNGMLTESVQLGDVLQIATQAGDVVTLTST